MSGNEGDILDDEFAQRLSRANPYDPKTLDAHLPPQSGELVLREITARGRTSFLDRLQGRLEGLATPNLSGRAAFVGVLTAIAMVVVGINLGLPGPDRQDVALPGASEGIDGLESASTVPVPPTTALLAESSSVADGRTDQPGTDPASGTELAPDPSPAGSGPEVPETQTTSGPHDAVTSIPGQGSASGNCVSLEAEQLVLTGAWRIGYDDRVGNGAFVTWEGLSPAESNDVPIDVIEAEITITSPGTYRFVWAMRQPVEVDDANADASWVNFPDAARFGPIEGGTFDGFVSVFGRAKGEFDWTATADHNGQQSEIGIVFDSAGAYTVQLAGRAHGHEIDQILIYRDSVSQDDAINGRCDAG